MHQHILTTLNTNKNDELYREARKITTVAYDYAILQMSTSETEDVRKFDIVVVDVVGV